MNKSEAKRILHGSATTGAYPMLKMRANSLTIQNSPRRTARTIMGGPIPTRAGAIVRQLRTPTKAGSMPLACPIM